MKKTLIVLANCLVLVYLSGCATTLLTEKVAGDAAPPKVENFSFDQSKPGADSGKLTVQFRQPSYQMSVERYAVKIDSNPALVVSKQSDAEIKLAAGKHSLKFYAVSSNPKDSEKVSFGAATTREIVITKDKEQKLKYTGPYRLTGEGKVEVIQ
jgi:hypothetical protein